MKSLLVKSKLLVQKGEEWVGCKKPIIILLLKFSPILNIFSNFTKEKSTFLN